MTETRQEMYLKGIKEVAASAFFLIDTKDAKKMAAAKKFSKLDAATYKKEANKAFKISIRTTLDENNFYSGIKKVTTTKDLKPIHDSHVSFYGKAEIISDGVTINLISYSSCVLSYNRRSNTLLENYATKCSATTRRHVYEFLRQVFGTYGGHIVWDRLD